MNFKALALSLLTLPTLIACGNTSATKPIPNIPEQKSALTRETSTATEAEVRDLAEDNAKFAGRMNKKLSADNSGGNVVFSPHSISIALAMTYAGAAGSTASEIKDALSFDTANLHDAFNSLDVTLGSRNIENSDVTKALRFDVANSLFADQSFAMKSGFLDTLAKNYGAGVKQLDFKAAAEAARTTINEWVEAKTQDKIQDLLQPGTVDASTRLVLVNAVYLKAAWLSPFQKEATANDTFTSASGSATQIPFMSQTSYFAYGSTDDADTVEMSYVGNKLAMTLVLPKAGKFNAVAANPEWLRNARTGLESARVQVKLPKFKLEPAGVSLADALKSLGMNKAFSDAADFSALSEEPVVIGDVIHKAFIAVDEQGTEAAAATAVIAEATGAPEEPKVVTFNRPFLFSIVDKDTGAILFMGQVTTL